jgi:hypothetical protein
VVKILLVCASLTLFFSYAFKDYSSLIPAQLNMDVYFDDKGIRHTLAAFKKDELAALNVSPDWPKFKEQFFSQADAVIEKTLGPGKGIFLENNRKGWVHSSGYVMMQIESTKEWQVYYLKDIRGHLTHKLERPGLPPMEVVSDFSSMDTEDSYVRGSLWDLFAAREKIIRPMFKQALSSPETNIFQFMVVGITRVRVFPTPCIGPTLYCVHADTGELVPIGYAIYRPR